VQGLQLTRVDGRLAEEAQRSSELRLITKTVVVTEQREDAVDGRLDRRGAGCQHQMRPRMEGLQVANR
jgi:hypothetical protein